MTRQTLFLSLKRCLFFLISRTCRKWEDFCEKHTRHTHECDEQDQSQDELKKIHEVFPSIVALCPLVHGALTMPLLPCLLLSHCFTGALLDS